MSLRPDKEPLSAALCSLQLLCAFLKVGKGGLGCGPPERSLWSLSPTLCGGKGYPLWLPTPTSLCSLCLEGRYCPLEPAAFAAMRKKKVGLLEPGVPHTEAVEVAPPPNFVLCLWFCLLLFPVATFVLSPSPQL